MKSFVRSKRLLTIGTAGMTGDLAHPPSPGILRPMHHLPATLQRGTKTSFLAFSLLRTGAAIF